jgi:hypothetical protein
VYKVEGKLMYIKMFGKFLAYMFAILLGQTSLADNFIPYGTPKIDGVLSANEWHELGHLRMARFYGNDQFTDIWMMWDDNNLYVAGKLQDTSFQEDGGGKDASQTWHDDSLEIYLHPTFPLPGKLDENSRVLAFTPTGKYRRFDRGCWSGDKDCQMTTGLEKPGNAINKINDPGTFFNTDLWMWQASCVAKQPEPNHKSTVIKFAPSSDENKEWRFEAAIPWQLVGTKIDSKIVEGQDCPIGNGVIPNRFPVKDGTPLWMNFYRIHADDFGAIIPDFKGKMTNAVGTQSPNGIMKNEWTVYQGDRFHPNEWQAFILVNSFDQRVPFFEDKYINSWPVSAVDGRRVRIQLKAPRRANGGSAYRYRVRYKEGKFNVNKETWESMTTFAQSYFPVSPGNWQEFDVIGLTPGKHYTFAVRAVDEQGRISDDILVTEADTPNNAKKTIQPTFVTVSPTGRSLMLSDGTPFVIVGETGLMPWLPLRGLYPSDLCDENPSPFLTDPPPNSKWERTRTCTSPNGKNRKDEPINGVWRNYSTEKIFYHCIFTNKPDKVIALLEPSDTDPKDNCLYKESPARTLDLVEAVEGAGVAEDYFKKLKDNGINVITVFVESLDLDASPIFLDQKQSEVIKFLDNVLNLARQNNIYVLFRLYDTFYYKDDNFNSTGRKWADTLWAKKIGATKPDDFFEESLYNTHKERMKPLLERYRDDSNVFGWDIVNEIDNKERFNTASYEKRKKWLIEMSKYAKDIDRNHLVFYSFLTWDPKDSTFYRASIGATANELTGEKMDEAKYLGMDAELAYRLPNIDMAVTHAYYAHVANPWDASPFEFFPPLEMARGISYGFYQIRDGRPMQDGESSPNVHLYRKGYGDNGFDEVKDNQYFRDSAWLHFLSGGAGANLAWPADFRQINYENKVRNTVNQLSDAKRTYLKHFKNTVDGIKWRGDKLAVDHYVAPSSSSNGLTVYTRQDGTNAILYVYNPSKKPINDLIFPELPNGEASVKVVNPENGSVVFDGKAQIGTAKTFSFPPVSDSVAVIIQGMSGGSLIFYNGPTTPPPPDVEENQVGYLVTPDTWLNAKINTVEHGPIDAVWKKGGDQVLARGDRVIWGYFYASPKHVTWGSEDNPDIFVKIWFDVSGRVDVNFFHVSVPNIEVFSCMKQVGNCSPSNHVTTQEKRYARHSYKPNDKKLEVAELLNTPALGPKKAEENPKHYLLPFQQVELGGTFQLDDGRTIIGAWKDGGSGTTKRGDQVAWGYFYANPKDVTWGSEQNPDVYVKFWYDNAEKRVDVNFFHVSAPNITVYSGRSKTYEGATVVTEKERYAQHQYKP